MYCGARTTAISLLLEPAWGISLKLTVLNTFHDGILWYVCVCCVLGARRWTPGVAFAEACWLGAWLPEGATTAVPVDTPFGREIAGASDDAIKARESEMVRAGATDTPVN